MKPFSGIRIIDFTQAHAGSLATMLLADMGAEVIKIERAGSGDLARSWAPFVDGKSGYYAFLNRGKRSVALNLNSPGGKEAVQNLIATADVLCENFKTGSMERLGLTYEDVRAIKPDIIYASLNGFGQTGPMGKNIGLDLHLQAMSGVADSTGFPDGAPVRIGVAFADHLSGTYMAQAVALALMEREKTGRGQQIDIAILDSLFALKREELASPRISTTRNGNTSRTHAPCDCFRVKDGWFLLHVTRDEQWNALCQALSLNELAGREDLRTNAGRLAAVDELKNSLAERISEYGKLELEEVLKKANVPCSAVYSVAESLASERSSGLMAPVNDKAIGKIRIPDSHFCIDNIDTHVTEAAPLRGEHSAYYLKQVGYSDSEIASLVAQGAVETEEV